MASDFCSYVRNRIGEKLAKQGLEECDCRRFGEELRGHGAMIAADVAYYQGRGLCVAIRHSDGDGTSCFIGQPGSDPTTYEEWPSLWEMTGMTTGFIASEGADIDPQTKLDAMDAYLAQFPQSRDGMTDLIAMKLAELARA